MRPVHHCRHDHLLWPVAPLGAVLKVALPTFCQWFRVQRSQPFTQPLAGTQRVAHQNKQVRSRPTIQPKVHLQDNRTMLPARSAHKKAMRPGKMSNVFSGIWTMAPRSERSREGGKKETAGRTRWTSKLRTSTQHRDQPHPHIL